MLPSLEQGIIAHSATWAHVQMLYSLLPLSGVFCPFVAALLPSGWINAVLTFASFWGTEPTVSTLQKTENEEVNFIQLRPMVTG